jgi:hypothetical protein
MNKAPSSAPVAAANTAMRTSEAIPIVSETPSTVSDAIENELRCGFRRSRLESALMLRVADAYALWGGRGLA